MFIILLGGYFNFLCLKGCGRLGSVYGEAAGPAGSPMRGMGGQYGAVLRAPLPLHLPAAPANCFCLHLQHAWDPSQLGTHPHQSLRETNPVAHTHSSVPRCPTLRAALAGEFLPAHPRAGMEPHACLKLEAGAELQDGASPQWGGPTGCRLLLPPPLHACPSPDVSPTGLHAAGRSVAVTRRSGAIKHLPGARCLQIIAAAPAETVHGEERKGGKKKSRRGKKNHREKKGKLPNRNLPALSAAMPSHPAGAALLALALCVLLEDGEPRDFGGPGCSRGLGAGGTAGQFLPGCARLPLCALESPQRPPECAPVLRIQPATHPFSFCCRYGAASPAVPPRRGSAPESQAVLLQQLAG